MNKYLVAAIAAVGFAQPAFAQGDDDADSKAGLRIQAQVTLETPTVSSVIEDDDVYKLGSGVAFGGEVGFDIALGGSVVAGPYAVYEVSTVENCDGTDCVRATDNYAFGLHVGVKAGRKGLIYGKVGYASLGIEAESAGITVDERGGGFQGAIGYEHGFGRHFYGRVEFGYGDNGEIFGTNFQRRHAGLALGARF